MGGTAVAAADRPSQVVTMPAARRPDAFAACVQAVLEEHPDVASEDFWQAVSRLVLARWRELSHDQPPVQSLAMVKQCTETILRIRRSAAGPGSRQRRCLGGVQGVHGRGGGAGRQAHLIRYTPNTGPWGSWCPHRRGETHADPLPLCPLWTGRRVVV